MQQRRLIALGIILFFSPPLLLAQSLIPQNQLNFSSTTALQAQFQALTAELAALKGGTAGPLGAKRYSLSCAVTRYLAPRSSGTSVSCLQGLLIAKGYLTIASPTGYFGSVTEAALQAFQASQGVVSSGNPASTGYGAVGSRTRALINTTIDGGVYVLIDASGHVWPIGAIAASSARTPVATAMNTTTTTTAVLPAAGLFTPAPVTCTLSADPTSVIQGSPTTLSWTTDAAASVTIDNGVGSVPPNGSESVIPPAGVIYALTAANAAGSGICTAFVTVVPATTQATAQVVTTGVAVASSTTGTVVVTTPVATSPAPVTGPTQLQIALGPKGIASLTYAGYQFLSGSGATSSGEMQPWNRTPTLQQGSTVTIGSYIPTKSVVDQSASKIEYDYADWGTVTNTYTHNGNVLQFHLTVQNTKSNQTINNLQLTLATLTFPDTSVTGRTLDAGEFGTGTWIPLYQYPLGVNPTRAPPVIEMRE